MNATKQKERLVMALLQVNNLKKYIRHVLEVPLYRHYPVLAFRLSLENMLQSWGNRVQEKQPC